jgi:lysophospholipid acyltransferase (LPLAT)-like uncharacterized protein
LENSWDRFLIIPFPFPAFRYPNGQQLISGLKFCHKDEISETRKKTLKLQYTIYHRKTEKLELALVTASCEKDGHA